MISESVRPVDPNSYGSSNLFLKWRKKIMEIHGNPEPHLAKNAMSSGPRSQAKYR